MRELDGGWPHNYKLGPSSTRVERRYPPAEATVVIGKITCAFPSMLPLLAGRARQTAVSRYTALSQIERRPPPCSRFAFPAGASPTAAATTGAAGPSGSARPRPPARAGALS